jgi:hypothetical protein
MSLRHLFLGLLLLTMFGCAVQPIPEDAVQKRYLHCENYLAYPICAVDIDQSGDMDYMYFSDSMKIFMYIDPMQTMASEPLIMHDCAQQVDQTLRDAASAFFYTTEKTGFFKLKSLKTKLMFQMLRYQKATADCNNKLNEEAGSFDDDEGFDDF